MHIGHVAQPLKVKVFKLFSENLVHTHYDMFCSLYCMYHCHLGLLKGLKYLTFIYILMTLHSNAKFNLNLECLHLSFPHKILSFQNTKLWRWKKVWKLIPKLIVLRFFFFVTCLSSTVIIHIILKTCFLFPTKVFWLITHVVMCYIISRIWTGHICLQI
jgi:hypothetical protein